MPEKMPQFNNKSSEDNKQGLKERLGPLFRKYFLLLLLVAPAMVNAQESNKTKVDGKTFFVVYENNPNQVKFVFGQGVDAELAKEGIEFKTNGRFETKKENITFDNNDPTSSPTDSVLVNKHMQQTPGGSKIEDLKILAYNKDGSIEHLTFKNGEVSDYSKEIKK